MVTGEDTHGDHSCQMLFPWCRRMIVFMDPDGALWQRRGTTLPHLGEDTLAGCEMKLNKVTPTVIARPVTHLPPAIEEFKARALCYVWRILCLYLSFVWARTWPFICLSARWCWKKEREDRNRNSMNMFVSQWIRKSGLSHVSPGAWKSLVSLMSPLWDSLSWTRLEVQLNTTRVQHASHRRALPDEPTPRAHDNLDDWSLSSRLRREGTERSAETTTTTKMEGKGGKRGVDGPTRSERRPAFCFQLWDQRACTAASGQAE